MNDLIARASTTVHAPASAVWRALTDPQLIKKYMFGTTVVSDWKKGSPVVWKGEWQGKPYEDKGVILELEPGRRLQYSHFSPLSGQPDVPENYHIVTVELKPQGAGTRVSLEQNGNPTEEERDHSAKNWAMMLEALKAVVEAK